SSCPSCGFSNEPGVKFGGGCRAALTASPGPQAPKFGTPEIYPQVPRGEDPYPQGRARGRAQACHRAVCRSQCVDGTWQERRPPMSAATGLLTAVLLAVLTILPAHADPGPTQTELDAAAVNATDWLHTNHDYGGQRFVNITGVTRQNASQLQPACSYDVGDYYPFYTNPLVYRGVIYLTTPSDTIALDAATC